MRRMEMVKTERDLEADELKHLGIGYFNLKNPKKGILYLNEAARLTELAKSRASRVLASESILHRAGEREAARWELGEPVVLRGRPGPTRIAAPA